MQTVFSKREDTIEIWVNEAYDALKAVFPNKSTFVDYINKITDPLNAELLIRSAQYYLVAKEYQKDSFVKLIMILSLTEKLLSGQNEFQEFPIWVQGQDRRITRLLCGVGKCSAEEYKRILDVLTNEYYQVFGSRRNVLKFFENHMDLESKIDVISAISPHFTDTVTHYTERLPQYSTVKNIEELSGKANHVISKHLMPYCYNWQKCYLEYADCDRSLGCVLEEDKDILEKCLKKVVDLLYQIRNDFVHAAVITPLTEGETFVYAVVGGKEVTIELNIEDFEHMFEKAFKHYFDALSN
jgi:hypothetical protein